MQSSMLSTQCNYEGILEFIHNKCTKDHFASKNKDYVKHSSVYASDYHTSKNTKQIKQTYDVAKERNSPIKMASSYLFPLSSVYRYSFEKNEVTPPIKYQERPTFFLKPQRYEPITSTYNRSLVLRQNDQNCALQKGRPQIDNLCLARTNKMNTKSLYRDSYGDYTKLPSIHKETLKPTLIPQKQNAGPTQNQGKMK